MDFFWVLQFVHAFQKYGQSAKFMLQITPR